MTVTVEKRSGMAVVNGYINGLSDGQTITPVTVSSTQISISVTAGANASRLTWAGIKVRPTNNTATTTGNITFSGITINGLVAGTTNFGTLTVVPGAFNKMYVTLPGETFTTHSGNSGTVTAQTAGTPFNLTLTATDQFINRLTTTYTGAKTISYTGPGGTPTYTTSVTFATGQATTVATTLFRAETTAITATESGISGPASSSLTVNPLAFSKLQLLLPGETAAPGTATGKSGTPTAQTYSTSFNAIVNAVDSFWNLISAAPTDNIQITSATDARFSAPADAALAGGTRTFSVALRSVGAQTLTATNLTQGGITANTSSSVTVNPVTLGLAGVTASNKVYDATTTATFTGTATLVGVISPDVVSVSGPTTGTFADKSVGNFKTVTLVGLALGDADAAYYTLPAVTQTANITSLTLGLAGLSADKTYDGTTTATFTGTASLINTLAADAVTLSGTPAGTFADKNVGNFKTVSLVSLTLSGADAGNYALPATLTANITPFTLGIAGLNADRIYDATTAATFTGTASLINTLAADAVSILGTPAGVFANKNVGNLKTVSLINLSLGGADGSNYALPSLSASITAKGLTVTGITAANKAFDGNTTATLTTSSAALAGVVTGDAVTLNTAGATGTFASADVGTGKTVTITGLTLSGADAGNYSLAQPSTTAEIFAVLAINSGPTATPNPALVGAQVQFSCNTNLANSTYSWDFGDGTSDASGASTVNHAYATASVAGGYRVTVTAKNGTQTVSATVNVVVNVAPSGGGGATPAAPALPLSITKKSLKGKVPSVGRDTLTINGSLTLKEGTTTLAATVSASAGGISNSFSLSTKGSAKSGSSAFMLKGKSKKGVLLSTTVTFQVKLAGDFIAELDKAGVPAGTSGSATIPLIITIDGIKYAADVSLNVSSNGKTAKGN